MAKLVDRESLKAFRQANDERYAKPDGNYPTMAVGYADLAGNLDSKVVKNDLSAYLFRTAGGSLEIGDYCKINHITGGSIGFNQLVQNGNFASTSGWTPNVSSVVLNVANNVAEIIHSQVAPDSIYSTSAIPSSNHKYLISYEAYGNTNGLRCGYGYGGVIEINAFTCSTTKQRFSAIFSATQNTSTYRYVGLYVRDIGTYYISNAILIDLTAMFGSTIADYIYSLETQTAGAGVAWFKRYFTKDYYPYTPIGSFVNVMTKGKKYVGFNQWDEEWELGDINTVTGQPQNNSTYIRSKNFNQCIPNTTYYGKSTNRIWLFWYDKDKNYIDVTTGGFLNTTKTSPSNAYFFKITCNANTYNHDICINFHYDGERDGEYEPYKTHTVDLDTNWNSIGIPQIDENGNLYFIGNRYNYDGSVDEIYDIRDYQSGDENDNSVFTNGVKTIYAKTTPTQSTATPFLLVQKVDNWGTEQFLAPDNDTRVCEVPVGHDTDYPLDCKSKIEIAPDLPDNDGVYVCKVESGVASYTDLATWLGANGYVKQVDLSNQVEVQNSLTKSYVSFTKTGNVYNLSFRLINETGVSIGINSAILKLPNGTYGTDFFRWFFARYPSANGAVTISTTGYVTLQNALSNDGVLSANISYVI